MLNVHDNYITSFLFSINIREMKNSADADEGTAAGESEEARSRRNEAPPVLPWKDGGRAKVRYP